MIKTNLQHMKDEEEAGSEDGESELTPLALSLFTAGEGSFMQSENNSLQAPYLESFAFPQLPPIGWNAAVENLSGDIQGWDNYEATALQPMIPQDYPQTSSQQVSTNPSRYSNIEAKALVHAKIRLNMATSVGESATSDANNLKRLYEWYLHQLSPDRFRTYPRREGSALLRKFKSLKQGPIPLTNFFDETLDGGFWRGYKIMLKQDIKFDVSNNNTDGADTNIKEGSK